MATDVERLVVALEARTTAFERALRQANGSANRQARSIERRFQQMNRNLSAGFAGLGSSLTKAFAVAGGIRGMQTLLDSATRIDNALKVAGLSGAELEKVYNRLRDSALRNAAPLETLVTLYGRAALVQKELGVSQEEMLNFTDKIALALRVAGTDAQSASGALLQLSQALGSGVVRAEEFNSILEGALPIAQAAAAGLKEAGGSVAALRGLVVDGKVSSEAFFRAFEAGSVILEQKVAGATLTTSQGFTNLQTALVDAMHEFAQGSMAAETLGNAFGAMADKINSIDFKAFGEQARELVGLVNQVREAIGWLGSAGANIGAAIGTDAIGDALTGGAAQRSYLGGALTITNQRGVQRRFDEAFGSAVEAAAGLAEDAIRKAAGTVTTERTGRLASSAVTPVSLSDFAAPAGKKSGGGSGKGTRERADEYQRLAERIRESTVALQAETVAMAGINPLIDDYGYAVEKARTQQELLSAAKKAGLAVTPELTAKINELAEGYANATVAAAQLSESQDKARQTAEDFRSLGKDVLGGFIRDIKNGTSATEALSNALGKVADKLLDMALNNLFSGKGFGGGGKGGLFGGFLIPGILHSGGVAGRDGYGHGRAVSPSVFTGAKRYHKGGIAGLQPGEVPAILQRGEVVLPRGTKAGTTQPASVRVEQHYHISGAISSRDVQQMVEQGAARSIDTVKRSLTSWQGQIARDGAI